MPELLRATSLVKTWLSGGRPIHAVRDVSLAVEAGETLVIRGPSGSGKTTLLTLLGGLLRPDAGRVVVDGVDLSTAADAELDAVRRGRLGFVFQRGLLLADLSACENVELALRAAGRSPRESSQRARALLDGLGLLDRADLLPEALSAGECQRVAVARALAHRPRVVFADEPTAHLDSATGAAVAAELKRLAVECGSALVIVTHDERLAAIGDRVAFLSDGRLDGAASAAPASSSYGDAAGADAGAGARPAAERSRPRRGLRWSAPLAAATALGIGWLALAHRPSSPPSATQSRSFRYGDEGYTDTQDVEISSPAGATSDEPAAAERDRALLEIGSDGESTRLALLRFGSLVLPPGARVVAATLTLAVEAEAPQQIVQGAVVARPWSDAPGAGGVGWTRRAAGRAWAVPGIGGAGADFIPHRGFRMSDFATGREMRRIAIDPRLVQQWVDRPDSSYGFALRTESARGRVRIAASEHPDPALRPRLEVRFELADGAAARADAASGETRAGRQP